MPQYAPDVQKVMALSSFIYSADQQKWIAIKHSDAIQSNESNAEQKQNDIESELPKELTILSYNVWFADQQWKERRTKLLEMLKEINPDIFCLQEVTHRFLWGLCEDEYIREHFEISDEKDNIKMSTIAPYGVMIGCNRKKSGLSMSALQICRLKSNMNRRLVSGCIRLNGQQTMWINTVHLESLNNAKVRMSQLDDIFGEYVKDQGDAMLMGGMMEDDLYVFLHVIEHREYSLRFRPFDVHF